MRDLDLSPGSAQLPSPLNPSNPNQSIISLIDSPRDGLCTLGFSLGADDIYLTQHLETLQGLCALCCPFFAECYFIMDWTEKRFVFSFLDWQMAGWVGTEAE